MAIYVCPLCNNQLNINSEEFPERYGWQKNESFYYCCENHASIRRCLSCDLKFTDEENALQKITLQTDGNSYFIVCSLCDIKSPVFDTPEKAIIAWNFGERQNDYEEYLEIKQQLIESTNIDKFEQVDITDKIKNKKNYLENNVMQKRRNSPLQDSKKVCTKCQKVIEVNNYKIVLYPELDLQMIHCPNYPNCMGTDLNWVPK